MFEIPLKHNCYLNIDLDGIHNILGNAHLKFFWNQKLKKQNGNVVRTLIWIGPVVKL